MACPGSVGYRFFFEVVAPVVERHWPAFSSHIQALEVPHVAWEPVIGAVANNPTAIGAVFVVVAAVAAVSWRALTKKQTLPLTTAPVAATAHEKDGPALSDTVNCSVFAPRHVAARCKFTVQAYLHLLEDYDTVEREAEAIDATATPRAFKTLSRPIARGALVDLLLFSDDLTITAPKRRQIRWEGRPAQELFEAEAPADLTSDTAEAVLHVHVDGIPVGHIEFKVYIEPDVPISDRPSGRMSAASSPAEQHAETRATSYRKAFVSYARRADFEKASAFAQCLEKIKIELLMDVISLEPGQEWEKELPALIAKADVFFLMWTDDAAKSKWVKKEARLAVRLYNDSDARRPSIEPIAWYRPIPKLPRYLKKFHFHSRWVDMRTAQREQPLFDETSR
ncbi:MAG: toll/interleukin-1 receptor domain-containing protein [Xanthobacteraceae bacterium]